MNTDNNKLLFVETCVLYVLQILQGMFSVDLNTQLRYYLSREMVVQVERDGWRNKLNIEMDGLVKGERQVAMLEGDDG
jgi:hypothetical protein